jgi:hypothetical protein
LDVLKEGLAGKQWRRGRGEGVNEAVFGKGGEINALLTNKALEKPYIIE